MNFCVCLLGIMENSENCYEAVVEFYYVISVGTMISARFEC